MRTPVSTSPSKSCSGFSLVEILVALSIIATLSIVAYVWAQWLQTNRYNSKRVADIATLGNALETHMLQTKTLPEPTANRQYYDSDGSYSHSSSGAFGVSSSFSEDILGKYALTSHPRDPDTGGYYTYAKSYEKTPHYEIAAVLKQEGTPTAYVRGNYKGDPLPSLVKGYNSTSFVVDGGTSVLPYNPIEKAVTATIESSSGAVSITPTKPITAPLVTGDTLTVGTGWIALVKVSDGSELIVGSSLHETKLVMQELSLKDDSGLLTRVRLLLSSGEIVTKAPKLRTESGNRSEFEIETGGAVAAVRGTVFRVDAGAGWTSSARIILQTGKLEVTPTSPVWSAPSSTTMEVPEWDDPEVLQVTPTTAPGGTPSIAPIASSTPEYILAVNTLTGALENGESGFDGVISAPEELTLTGSSTDSASYSGTGTIRVQRIRGTQYVRIVSPAVQNESTVVYFETRNRIQNVSFKLTKDPTGKPFQFQLCSNRFERGDRFERGERCTKFYKVTVGTVTGQPVSLSKLGNKVFVEAVEDTAMQELSFPPSPCDESRVVGYVDMVTEKVIKCSDRSILSVNTASGWVYDFQNIWSWSINFNEISISLLNPISSTIISNTSTLTSFYSNTTYKWKLYADASGYKTSPTSIINRTETSSLRLSDWDLTSVNRIVFWAKYSTYGSSSSYTEKFPANQIQKILFILN